MESLRDPLPADMSAEPEPTDPPPAEVSRPEPAAAVPRPRDPGEPTEPLRLCTPAESLPPGRPAESLRFGSPAESPPPGDADLIAASRAGDAAAYDTLYRRHVAAAHSLARQLVRNRAEAEQVASAVTPVPPDQAAAASRIIGCQNLRYQGYGDTQSSTP